MVLAVSGNVHAAMGGNATPVEVVAAERVELAPGRWIAGSVISRDDAQLASEIAGRVVSLAEFGAVVDIGQTLAKLEDVSIRIRLDEAQAEVNSLTAKLSFFEAEAQRLERLAKDNHSAKNRLDEVVSERDQTRGTLAMSRARVADIKYALEQSIIVAPFAGVVAEQVAEIGEWMDAGDTVVRLVSTERIEIRGRVQQQSVALINPGDSVAVDSQGETIMATVRTLVPVGDAQSRLYEMRVDFQQPTWRVGRAVRIKIPTAKPKTVVALPLDALVVRQNSVKVFRILDDQTAEAVAVTTGIADQGKVEIIGDIQPGDKVVVRGNERLRASQKVQVRQADKTAY